jgi:hypothetical protein
MITTRYIVAGALTCCCALSFSKVLADEPTYTKTASLPPLRITYAELQSVLDKCAALLSSPSASPLEKPFSETVRLKHGETQVEIVGHQLQGAGAKLPKLATELWYTASRFPRSPAPVTTVSMMFYDYDRKITVEGQSPEQVDAVFATLKSDFLALSSPIGGSIFRAMTGVILLMICVLVALLGAPNWFATRDKRLITPVLLACLGITFLFVLPFDQLLAGFLVTEFDPSFASRYGPELSLLGVFLTLVGIPFSYLLPVWFAKPSEKDAALLDVTANPSLKGTRRKRRAP